MPPRARVSRSNGQYHRDLGGFWSLPKDRPYGSTLAATAGRNRYRAVGSEGGNGLPTIVNVSSSMPSRSRNTLKVLSSSGSLSIRTHFPLFTICFTSSSGQTQTTGIAARKDRSGSRQDRVSAGHSNGHPRNSRFQRRAHKWEEKAHTSR